MAKGIPATTGAEAIAFLYRDARGPIWGDREIGRASCRERV